MEKYDFKAIEAKWQKAWDDQQAFAATNDYSKPKYYALVEFPYPSGAGLHVGHPRSYTALDIVARKRRMQGYNVLYPMGWDAFGLPTENFAIKNHVHPAEVTKQNVARFKSQLKALGLSFDWNREINTTDPEYYKWTQWIFLQLFKKGLAYKKEMAVNWCTSCKCVLANEEVVNGVCERCGSEVIRKNKSQWMLKITEYAQRLIDDLDDVDYIDRVKSQQRHWIGRSTGAEVDFKTTEGDVLTVYTTRPDTLFGATYMVISPEHPMVEKWADKLTNIDAIRAYREEAAHKSDFERTELVKDKTGVKLDGVRAINPVNGTEIPIFVSDYVLMSYGTGAIMAVPAHDDRDWAFAKKFDLPIIEVVKGGNVQEAAFTDCATGIMVNSGFLDGMTVEEAKKAITEFLTEKGVGHAKVNYKLRDWVFSRQRYWGEPIPMVSCPKCGWVPVPEDQLPLVLPQVESYEPTESFSLEDGQVCTTGFAHGEMVLCARSPHITMGNLYLARNTHSYDLLRYFNLTPNIICVNAIESNIQQRLNGCDYDSDSMLVTNDEWIIAGVTGCYNILKVPVCKAEPIGKTDYENTPRSLAALDQTIAKNKIGEIVNLSQFLNCLLWDGLFTEQGDHHPMDIYHDICILAVLSGMEIDKAKRLYSADSTKVLSRLRHYRQNYKRDHGGNLPAFYKYIVGDETPDVGENSAHLEAPMAFVHDAVDAFPGRAAYTRTLSLSDLFELDASDAGANDTHKKQNIIKAVKEAHTKITAMQTAMKEASDDEKLILCDEANEVYKACLKIVSKNVANDHILCMLLDEIDHPDKSKYDIKSARYLLFASLLYEDNRRLLSKIKTVEGFEPYDLVRVDPESVPEGYRTEDIYGFPHGHLLIK